MKKFIILFIVFLILPIVNAICIIPDENIEIKENTAFCSGIYNLESGVNIVDNNVIINCNNSILIGNGIGYGILLKDRYNITIQNCNISNYEIGVYLDNTNNSKMNSNHLSKNKFGIALFNSFNNNVDNNILIENIRANTITYLPTSLLEEKEVTGKMEEISSPTQIMEEVIKVKNPFLEEDEILKEVDFILNKYFNISQQNLEITRAIFYNETDKSTKIILYLKPKKMLLNVSIYEKIPKCVSTYVNQILFETGGYEVISDDPLILWTFARLDKDMELSYKVFKNMDEECKKLLFAFGIATEFEEFEKKLEEKQEKIQFNYLWILLIVIVLIVYYLIIKISKKNKKINQ